MAEKISKEEIAKRVIEVAREELGINDSRTINSSTSFQEDLGADSLDLVEFVMALEEEFNSELPDGMSDDTLEDIKTVGDVVDYIYDKQVS